MRRSVGIWYNREKEILNPAIRVVRALEAGGARAVMDGELARAMGRPDAGGADFDGCEALIVLGGDGTFLSALDQALPLSIPLLGVNLGRVGYLSEIQVDSIERDIARFLSGDCRVEKRMLLEARIGGRFAGYALNDVCFNRSDSAVGVLSLEISVAGVVIDRFAGDGLVVASPTGSTAYSLSAGGPVVAPELRCMVLTPICPHTLHARPVVLSAEEIVKVRVADEATRARVYLDGRKRIPLTEEHREVLIMRADRDALFVRIGQTNFYDVLRRKLGD